MLEAISCALPVIAYKTKGPKDIITDGENGFLVNSVSEMKEKLSYYIGNKQLWESYRQKALQRAANYKKEVIMNELLTNIDLADAWDEQSE